jgi:cell division protein FtsL
VKFKSNRIFVSESKRTPLQKNELIISSDLPIIFKKREQISELEKRVYKGVAVAIKALAIGTVIYICVL